MDKEVKLTKKSWVPIETLAISIIMACSLTAIFIRGEVRGNQNSEKLSEVAKKLDEMVFQKRVENELSAMKMRDRWTSGMMGDHDLHWLSTLQPIFNSIGDTIGVDLEINAGDLPDIRTIQKKAGY